MQYLPNILRIILSKWFYSKDNFGFKCSVNRIRKRTIGIPHIKTYLFHYFHHSRINCGIWVDFGSIHNVPSNHQMAPDYDHLTLLQKVEVFEHALEHTNGDDLAKILWFKSPSSEVHSLQIKGINSFSSFSNYFFLFLSHS